MAASLKGIDAIPTIVHSDNEQLRASAITRMATIRQEISDTFAAADAAYRAKEQEYLAAVAIWRRSGTPQERGAAALTIGKLQQHLTKLDEERQIARYPRRFLQERKLQRFVVDPDTRDERVLQHVVILERPFSSDPIQRSIALM